MSAKLDIIGKRLGEAASVIDEQGFSFRVVSRDGVARVATREVDTNRVNLTLVDGCVTAYNFG